MRAIEKPLVDLNCRSFVLLLYTLLSVTFILQAFEIAIDQLECRIRFDWAWRNEDHALKEVYWFPTAIQPLTEWYHKMLIHLASKFFASNACLPDLLGTACLPMIHGNWHHGQIEIASHHVWWWLRLRKQSDNQLKWNLFSFGL